MFRNSIVPVLLVLCWVSSMGESGVVPPQETLQLDITDGYKSILKLYFFGGIKLSRILQIFK